ncbi:response regulator [Lichenifustis flavocetrariae]|uniref:response regulator n=1 Tax=Lichenifustis flavocetrariae TaxID=2949735 RepID=UPI003D11738F
MVDDDEEIRSLLARYLVTQGFGVRVASDRRGLHQVLERDGVDLVVLDVMLPDGSGIEICRDLRAHGSTVPIILLTALKEEVDRIIGLEVGADDYLGKPFNPRELAARIRAVLRRHGAVPEVATRLYRFEGSSLEPSARRVTTAGGHEVEFTAAEFDLLHTFVARPGRVLARDQLLDLTRGRDADPFDRSIDVLLSRIRRKLSDEGGARFIKTIRNGGYQFVARVEASGTGP